MFDLASEIMATLRNNKLRTALTGFAVSWGIFLLIVLLSVSRGLVNGMESMFAQRDTETVSIRGGYAQKAFKGLKENRRIRLKDSDMDVLESQNANVIADVAAQISNDSAKVTSSKDYLTGGYRGVYPTEQRNSGLNIVNGRFINQNDINQRRRVAVINEESAKTLFGEKEPVGQLVEICDLSFTVVGTYKQEWRRDVYIPYSTARSMSGGSDRVNNITVKLKNVRTLEESDDAETGFRSTLGRLHSFAEDDRGSLWIWNRFSDYMRSSSAMGAIGMAVWVIGLLTMLSGIVGVSNIMFVSVRERTHEIGVRRAIGAKPRSILKQIILESVAITTLFGYVGIVLGVLLSQGIAMLTESGGDRSPIKDPTVDIAIAIQVTLVLIIAGALAGLFPAMKSLKIKPVEALRDE
ncbi:ABC transporter permease [uncultured Duncaniella sp.]|jgi:putative ABC transport system permease protein|uniref:ABC transporter permease n=1 Tax=uncultured Duncaniella sp. TaxID=2768039 RepID=UPI0023CF45FF|nr:ABC transporter permease [uncultured Duncaniella sp.]MDE5665990.1 ABC transporter permease [Duncaniella sp.]MDE6187182.1 ABC transporter permease [Duncaniella sp.]